MSPRSSSRNVSSSNVGASCVATLTGTVYAVLGSAFFGLATGFLGLFLPRDRVFFHLARGWSKTVLFWSGIRYRCHFESDLSGLGSCILMPNHQSLYDIPLLLATLPRETRFLAKESLFRIPIFGWALRTGGFIPVRRGDRRKSYEAIVAAIAGLGDGVSILIFPEGTRTLDGRLLPFKRGGFLIAARSGLPVVPVGIRGTFAVRPKGRLVIHPGEVEVHYGRPLDPSALDTGNVDELVAEVRSRVTRLAGLEGA